MTELTDRKSPTASGSLAVWIMGGLIALMVIYALSPFPVYWLFLQSGYVNEEDIAGWLHWCYEPLTWLAQRSTVVEGFYDWFMSPFIEL